MTRHIGFNTGAGYPRHVEKYNNATGTLPTVSASVDIANLAPEGLDIRNFGDTNLFEMECHGNRLHYAEWASVQYTGILATYRNEPAAAMVIGGFPVELDWTLAPLTVAADEELIVKGTVAFGMPGTAGLSKSGGAAAYAGASAVIVRDSGAGYLVVAESRHGRAGGVQYSGAVVANSNTLWTDAFDLTPTLRIVSGTVRKLGISVGFDFASALQTASIARVQLATFLVKKCR